MFKMKDIVYIHETNFPEKEGVRYQVVGIGEGPNEGKLLLTQIDEAGKPVYRGKTWDLISISEEKVSLSPLEL